MIKKDTRPVKRAIRCIRFGDDDMLRFHPDILVHIVRNMARFVRERGRVLLSIRVLYYDVLEEYDMVGIKCVGDVVYVGKCKCRDGALRRKFRQAYRINGGNIISNI